MQLAAAGVGRFQDPVTPKTALLRSSSETRLGVTACVPHTHAGNWARIPPHDETGLQSKSGHGQTAGSNLGRDGVCSDRLQLRSRPGSLQGLG